MSDFHNLQDENRRLMAEVERLTAELEAARAPKLTRLRASDGTYSAAPDNRTTITFPE